MNNFKKLTAAVLAACLLSAGCGETSEATFPTPVADENTLILYTSHKEEVYGPIVKEFEERTGIWVEVRCGGTTELLDAIASEEEEGTCDVMFGGGVESYEAYSECFESYECAQKAMLDDTFRSKDGKWTVFSELPIVLIYNNKLVTEREAPKGWTDLLGGEWKGKISFADPGNSGTSCTALATMCQILDLTPEELVLALCEQLDGTCAKNSKAVIDEVKEGTRLVGVTLEETAIKAIDQGADLSIVYPAEGTSAVPDGCALVKGAPHADNARLFIDFTVSHDVQRIVEEQFCRRSVRTDMQWEESKEQLNIIAFDLEWASQNQSELLECWQEQILQER